MDDQKTSQDLGAMDNHFWVILCQEMQEPLCSVSCDEDGSKVITLFVTVLANFRILETFPFSHRISAYIARTLLPICLLLRVVETISFPSVVVLMVGLLGSVEDTDRNGVDPLPALGVRACKLDGLW